MFVPSFFLLLKKKTSIIPNETINMILNSTKNVEIYPPGNFFRNFISKKIENSYNSSRHHLLGEFYEIT